ncbi:MAG TPA: DUF1569 domain-containing protein, partial [Gemmatales bacterium]|nr:DUF1569 domain-containing protein [Gemmatales bacterium]
SYFMKGALEGYSFRVPWFVKKLFGNYFKNKILKSRRMKRGVYTPQNPLPASNLDEAEVVTDFLHLLDRFDKHPGEYQESPFFGKMSRDECRALNLIHCNHHLAFLLPRG